MLIHPLLALWGFKEEYAWTRIKSNARNIRQAPRGHAGPAAFVRICISGALSGLSGLLFPHQAGGSLVTANGKRLGAKLVGQEFTEAYFMKGRPPPITTTPITSTNRAAGSTTTWQRNLGAGPGSNNYAPSNPALTQRVEADIEAFLAENPGVAREDIPADLMARLGLDPHISPAAAQVQTSRHCRGFRGSQLRNGFAQIVAGQHRGEKLLGVFGEETVNVLGVNLDIALAMGLDFGNGKINAAEQKPPPRNGRRLLYTARARGAAGHISCRAAKVQAPCAPAAPSWVPHSAISPWSMYMDFVAGTDGGEPVVRQ